MVKNVDIIINQKKEPIDNVEAALGGWVSARLNTAHRTSDEALV